MVKEEKAEQRGLQFGSVWEARSKRQRLTLLGCRKLDVGWSRGGGSAGAGICSVRSFHSAKQPPRGEVTAPPPEPDEGGRSNPLWKSPSREHGGEQMLSFYSVAPVKTRAY